MLLTLSINGKVTLGLGKELLLGCNYFAEGQMLPIMIFMKLRKFEVCIEEIYENCIPYKVKMLRCNHIIRQASKIILQ